MYSETKKCFNLFLDTCYTDDADYIKNIIDLILLNKHPLGHTYLFIGKAGSGKTSLLHILYEIFRDNSNVYLEWECKSGKHLIPYLDNKIIFATSNKKPEIDNDDLTVFETTGNRLEPKEYYRILDILISNIYDYYHNPNRDYI